MPRNLCLLVSTALLAVHPTTTYGQSGDSLEEALTFLAADRLEGRGAGYPGEAEAARFIEGRFRNAGLRPVFGSDRGSFSQSFEFSPRFPEHPGQSLESRNIAGLLPGTDPDLSDEWIVLGAHFDGQGRLGQADPGRFGEASTGDSIWNSANDNASSTAALLELADWFATSGKRPRRSLLFIAFGAEEHGSIGSWHYVNAPAVALERHTAMLNFEMLGGDPGESLISASFVSSDDWEGTFSRFNRDRAEGIDPVLPDLLTDTDHYPFIAAGVSALVIGRPSGDITHTNRDEASEVDLSSLRRRVTVLRDFVEALDAAASLPKHSLDLSRELSASWIELSPREKQIQGISEDATAFRLAAHYERGLVQQAGLRVGDILTHVDGRVLADSESLELLRERFRTGEIRETSLELLRQGQVVTVRLPPKGAATREGARTGVPPIS